MTTPVRDRPDAILRAILRVEGLGTLSRPVKDMEDVTAGALPDLGVFLPLWTAMGEASPTFRPSKDAWETEHERWLREAVFRVDGINGGDYSRV
jgi:hypothetical protein